MVQKQNEQTRQIPNPRIVTSLFLIFLSLPQVSISFFPLALVAFVTDGSGRRGEAESFLFTENSFPLHVKESQR